MKKVLAICSLISSTVAFSQQPPGTEIFLFDLTVKKKKVTLSNPQNITNRAGYDNQPFFHPDQPLVYFTSADESGRTDILVYNYLTRITQKLTTTSEREYSPTVTPDKQYISCIIQREDGTQDLGKYPIQGGAPEVIINNLTVGYHTWADNGNAVVFVLGQPSTLRWYSVSEKKERLLTENIGRSLHRIPGIQAISFVDKQTPEWMIKKLNIDDQSIEPLTATLPGREDLAWTADRKILMSDGETIYFITPGKGKSWVPVEMPSSGALKGITRLSVNLNGNKIAVVVSE